MITIRKPITVPAVTYANDAIVIGKTYSKLVDRYKTEIGTWLLVANCCTANAEITGEMGWLTHEDMEAKPKTYYLGRLASLSSERYARRVYHHIIYRGISTGVIRKIAAIDSKLSADTQRHHTTSEKQCASTTRSEITAKRTHLWQEAMRKKQSLARYRQHTNAPAPYHQYPGDRASALLFHARTGALLTQKRRQELFGDDATCRPCGLEDENLEHVFYRCPHLQPSDTVGRDFDEVLGLKKTQDLVGNDQPVQPHQQQEA